MSKARYTTNERSGLNRTTVSKKNCSTKGQKFLVSQIAAQGTKVNSWEFYITKVGILSSDVPSNKHLALLVDFISTLGWGQFGGTVFLHTLKLALQTCITWLNLRYYVKSS